MATYAYQWQRSPDGVGSWTDITGATFSSYVFTTDDAGLYVRCAVAATNTGGTQTAYSNVLGPVVDPVPAARRFYQSPPWRFVILDLQTFETLSFLDHLMSSRSVTYTLNQPAVALGLVPSDDPEVNIPWPSAGSDPFLTEGSRYLLGFRREGGDGSTTGPWVIRFGGIIMQLEDVAESDDAFSHITAYDPWQYLFYRPVRNGPDFNYTLPGKNGSSYTQTRADVIIGEILRNTIHEEGFCGIDAGTAYGGTSYYGGTIENCAQVDINFQQGTSVGDAWQQLTNLDVCDIVLTPIYDPINRPGYIAELNVYTQAGTERDDAIFAWDKPSRSLVGISRLIDGTQRANAVKFFAGLGGMAAGGQSIPVQSDATSIAKFREYWRQQFWPGQNVADAVESLAAAQLALSKDGRTTVAISPAPERSPIPFEDYFLGDRVPVYASDRLRAPVSGYQRIYGIPIQIADDETETITQMLTAVQE